MDPIKKKLDKHEELVRAIVEGRSRFHDVSSDLSAEDAAEVRRRALEEIKRVSLKATFVLKITYGFGSEYLTLELAPQEVVCSCLPKELKEI